MLAIDRRPFEGRERLGTAEEHQSNAACPLLGATFEQVDDGALGPGLAFPVSEGHGPRTT